jgi:hypothetical protein
MKKSIWCLLPLLALCLVAAAKKEPEVSVRFYTEGVAGDTSSFTVPLYLQNPSRKIYVSKIANISEHDIAAIYPFQTADGSLGCVFLLTDTGKIALDALSVEKRGTSIIAVVNERPVISLLIDRRISDGILVIPNGLTVPEGLLLKKTFKLYTPPSSPTPPPASKQ